MSQADVDRPGFRQSNLKTLAEFFERGRHAKICCREERSFSGTIPANPGRKSPTVGRVDFGQGLSPKIGLAIEKERGFPQRPVRGWEFAVDLKRLSPGNICDRAHVSI